jgi:hypothetical protein
MRGNPSGVATSNSQFLNTFRKPPNCVVIRSSPLFLYFDYTHIRETFELSMLGWS